MGGWAWSGGDLFVCGLEEKDKDRVKSRIFKYKIYRALASANFSPALIAKPEPKTANRSASPSP